MAQLNTTPFWTDSVPVSSFPALDRDLTADVVVVGAGITGITAAYLLKNAGLSVVLLDRDRAMAADTGHTTAHLTCVTDLRLPDLVQRVGDEGARAVWDGGRMAIEQIQAHSIAEGIDCEFRSMPGYLHTPFDAADGDDAQVLRTEAELAQRLGFEACFVDRVPGSDRPGVRFESQADFNPRKYLSGLIELIPGEGSYVFEHSPVDDATDSPFQVRAGSHRVTCSYIVVATHSPMAGASSSLEAGVLQSKLALYTSYAIAGRMPSGRFPEALFWDTAQPYHYLRIDRRDDGDVVIFGGEDHKTGQEPDTSGRFAALERTLRAFAPEVDITHRWSGQVIETNDGLPYIGETAPRQFAATGFSGNGMTFGTLAAMMARDAVLGRPNPWRDLLDIHRTKIRGGAWSYLRENADYLYYMTRDRLAAAEGTTVRAVRPGHGRVIELDGEPVAAYRDEQGVLMLHSPICTHMGCRVAWNDAESTWDCPCHGSRFKPNGDVLAGPAQAPLPEVSVASVRSTA